MSLDLSKAEPYELQVGDGVKISYSFSTDKGNTYAIRLLDKSSEYKEAGIENSVVFEFQFYKVQGKDNSVDYRMIKTMIGCVEMTLSNIENVILYICDSDEHPSAVRARRFDFWYQKFSNDKFEKVDGEIKNGVSGETFCTSFIYSKENPEAEMLSSIFHLALNNIARGKDPSCHI